MWLNIYKVNRTIHDCGFKADQKRQKLMRYPCFSGYCGFTIYWVLWFLCKMNLNSSSADKMGGNYKN